MGNNYSDPNVTAVVPKPPVLVINVLKGGRIVGRMNPQVGMKVYLGPTAGHLYHIAALNQGPQQNMLQVTLDGLALSKHYNGALIYDHLVYIDYTDATANWGFSQNVNVLNPAFSINNAYVAAAHS